MEYLFIKDYMEAIKMKINSSRKIQKTNLKNNKEV